MYPHDSGPGLIFHLGRPRRSQSDADAIYIWAVAIVTVVLCVLFLPDSRHGCQQTTPTWLDQVSYFTSSFGFKVSQAAIRMHGPWQSESRKRTKLQIHQSSPRWKLPIVLSFYLKRNVLVLSAKTSVSRSRKIPHDTLLVPTAWKLLSYDDAVESIQQNDPIKQNYHSICYGP